MNSINIDEIKRDIAEQENLIKESQKKAEHYLVFTVIAFLICVYSIVMLNPVVSILSFIIGFLGIRAYNKVKGKAEVHSSIRKFLKMLLIQEQTGEDLFKSIIE